MSVSQKTKRNVQIPLRGVLGNAKINPNSAVGIKLKRHQKEEAANELGHSAEMFLRTYARWIEDFSANKDKSIFEGVVVQVPEKSRTLGEVQKLNG